jgi:hypothetical protein
VTLTSPVTFTGPDAASFTASAFGETTLDITGPGQSTTVTIVFQPSSGGAKIASAVIDSSGGSRIVALNGTASPGITLDVSALDFGAVPLGSTASATVTVINAASSSVTLTPPFVITGANASEFSVGAPARTTLAPEDTATVMVSVHPTTVGGKTATLTISSANGGSPAIALGASTCPAITVSGSLPPGFVGVPYFRALSASGGSGPYTFAIASGAPPSGLALAAGGLLSGTPAAAGTYAFGVKATDASGCGGTAPYTVGVSAATIGATPGSVNFGAVQVAAPASSPVTITNTSGFAVTLITPFTLTGADAAQFSVGAPETTTLGAGASTTAPVSFAPTSAGAKSATLNITSSSGGATAVALSGIGQADSVGSTLLISELRFRGPNGANDEFVELYNNTDAPVDISGCILKGSNSAGTVTNRSTVPAGTPMVPARGHYLFVNSGAGAPVAGLANQTYATGIADDGGVAITRPDNTILDQVGLSAGSAFKEGVPLASLGASNSNRSYERKPGGGNGSSIDAGDNATDFLVASQSDPQNLSNPITPAISLSSTAIEFGSVAAGAIETSTITVTNNSAATAILTPPFTIAGANPGDFSVSGPDTVSLPPGTTAALTVAFQPSSVGIKNAVLRVTTSAGAAPTVSLMGTAVCPAITLSTLPGGTFAAAYAQTITSSGGLGPYVVALTSGTLPGGLTLDSASLLAGTPSAAGTFAFAVSATDANGCGGAASYLLSIARATVAVSWPNPSPIVYGVLLGAGQLNATAAVRGLFVYSPGAGTLLNAGNAGIRQTLSVVFTPDDSADYDAATATASIDVSRRALTVAARDVSREFGAPNPAFSGSITGAVAADGITAAFSSSATPTSPVGRYPVVPSLSDPNLRLSNYTVTTISGTLTIVDTTAPALTLPANITTQSPAPGSAVVTFSATASDAVDGSVPVTCAPASGATFPAGTTAVACSATDAHANTANGSFLVTVTPFEPGRMIGDGIIAAGSKRHEFEFHVKERSTGAESGGVHYRVRKTGPGGEREDRFDATTVTRVDFSDAPGVSPGKRPPSGIDTVSFEGVGKWNGRSGYTFTAQAGDAGEPGRGQDTFAITVRDGSGQPVASVNRTLTGGNIQSLRMNR